MDRRLVPDPSQRPHRRRPWSALSSTLVDLIYPRRCAGCGRRGTWLCAACDGELPRFAAPWCDRCGVPAVLGPCRCAALPPAIDRWRAAAPFGGWLREAIIGFKYREEWSCAEHLASVLAPALHEFSGVDALVPVPLHPSRLRQRGYNQSALLAHPVAAALGIPVSEAVIRVRRTPQQVSLDAAQRRANVAGAFAVPPGCRVEGRTLVLVDDVVTTGATLAACAAALRERGASVVCAATLARE